MGWLLITFLTIEYIGYYIYKCETRHTLNQILTQVTLMNQNRHRNF